MSEKKEDKKIYSSAKILQNQLEGTLLSSLNE